MLRCCCSCNCFPKFWNFGPSFLFYLAWECLDSWTLFLFFPLLQFGLSWGQLFSCFSKNCLCLQMLWVLEFKVRSENVVLCSEWFLSVLSKVNFCLNQSFSSLCSRGVGEETNYFYRCTTDVFRNLTFLFGFSEVSRTWIAAIVLYCSRRFGSLVVYLTNVAKILISFFANP